MILAVATEPLWFAGGKPFQIYKSLIQVHGCEPILFRACVGRGCGRLELAQTLRQKVVVIRLVMWRLDRRRETVEHPFGSIKQWMNQGAFLTRGLASVNAEFSLTSIAYNLRPWDPRHAPGHADLKGTRLAARNTLMSRLSAPRRSSCDIKADLGRK